jgi:hypothetical protein
MDAHDAIKKMAHAYKTARLAVTHCTQGQVLSRIEEVRDIIYEVGEQKFGKDFINELHYTEAD